MIYDLKRQTNHKSYIINLFVFIYQLLCKLHVIQSSLRFGIVKQYGFAVAGSLA